MSAQNLVGRVDRRVLAVLIGGGASVAALLGLGGFMAGQAPATVTASSPVSTKSTPSTKATRATTAPTDASAASSSSESSDWGATAAPGSGSGASSTATAADTSSHAS
jgi:hypothetical protein